MPKKLTKAEFIIRASEIHDDKYDYSQVEYINSYTPVLMLCKNHGIFFQQIPNTHLRGFSNCKTCTVEKKKATTFKHYGVENPSQSKIIQQKKIETCLKNYGVKYPLLDKTINRKARQTMVGKYGVEHSTQSAELLEKIQKTNLDLYGNICSLHGKDIEKKVKQTNLERYGVEYPLQSLKIQEKLKKTNLEKYGVEHAPQKYYSEQTLFKLNDVEWLTTQHQIKEKALSTIANELNINDTTLGRYYKKHGIEVKSFLHSTGEKLVLSFIKSLGCNAYSAKNIIPPYELDVYIPDHKIAIEYCGLYWHSEQSGKDKFYHKRKHDLCKERGIQLITIFEDEWLQRNTQVKSKLKSLLGKDDRSKIFARKTTIINVSREAKKEFYNNNHIQGNGQGSINIGLVYNGIMVACMSFTLRSDDIYELSRYATSSRVVGGFSKILKYFKNNYKYSKIISFADLHWSNGNLYQKNGWQIDKILNPDYYYSPNAKSRVHKFNYRRKNLDKLLRVFDPLLSEKENCNNNGILRIWDCGKIRFVLENNGIL